MFLLQFMRNVSWRQRVLYTLHFPSWIPLWTESKNMNTHPPYVWGRGGKRLQEKGLQVRCDFGWSKASRKWTRQWEDNSNIIRKHQRILMQSLVLHHQYKDAFVDSSNAFFPYTYKLNGCILKTVTFISLFVWSRPTGSCSMFSMKTVQPPKGLQCFVWFLLVFDLAFFPPS